MGFKEADDLRQEAWVNLERAGELMKMKDYNGSVQAAQTSIELSIKSLIALVDLQVPKLHDPAEKMMKKVIDKLEFPKEGLYKEQLARCTWISKMSMIFNTIARYGVEGIEVIPSAIFLDRITP